MKYIIHMTDPRGNNKVKFVEASDVKEAEGKAKRKYASYEIGRISSDQMEINYYLTMKNAKQ
jgi:hypothetical protein